MSKQEQAVAYFNNGFLCSQSVLAVFAKECGLTEEQALKVSACFGSGMRRGEICGACSGGLMVLGCLFGRYETAHAREREKINALQDTFLKRFAEVNSSCLCKEILHVDVSTEEGNTYAWEHGLYDTICPQAIANSVKVLEEMLKEDNAQ